MITIKNAAELNNRSKVGLEKQGDVSNLVEMRSLLPLKYFSGNHTALNSFFSSHVFNWKFVHSIFYNNLMSLQSLTGICWYLGALLPCITEF